jgi:hypothetical protein
VKTGTKVIAEVGGHMGTLAGVISGKSKLFRNCFIVRLSNGHTVTLHQAFLTRTKPTP